MVAQLGKYAKKNHSDDFMVCKSQLNKALREKKEKAAHHNTDLLSKRRPRQEDHLGQDLNSEKKEEERKKDFPNTFGHIWHCYIILSHSLLSKGMTLVPNCRAPNSSRPGHCWDCVLYFSGPLNLHI